MPGRKREKKVSKEIVVKTNPSKKERDIVVLFADVIGCSEISNNKKIKDYNVFIRQFQDCFKKVCEHYRDNEYGENEKEYFDCQPRGDEGCLKIFIPEREELISKDVDVAINIALDLKREWLLEKENKDRINDGLLPVDLGIGIHSGKVYVNPDGKDTQGNNKYCPEGYAINLAKRVEGESRSGKFSRVFVSESARQHLYDLKDECTYRFDLPLNIKPKGISRDIKVFEVKHHFLPTDWADVEMPSEVSLIYAKFNEDKEKGRKLLVHAKKAHGINPTNLWLAEEYLLLIMMNSYIKYGDGSKQYNLRNLNQGYSKARDVAQQIANSDLRDAGLLTIWGFIEGEMGRLKDEQKRYKEAIDIDEQDGDIHWYLGSSKSVELNEDFKKAQVKIKEFYEKEQEGKKVNKESVEKILESYKKAFELRPMNPWIAYDYARELSRWSVAEKSFRTKALKMLIEAFKLNKKTKDWAKIDDEGYLKPIIDDPSIKKYLDQ